jgi:hypothetical protein
MVKVKATREGLVGQVTASGWTIDEVFPFVALPATGALHKWVKIFNPLTLQWCCAQVRDVGPFNTSDIDYVFGTARPLAEGGASLSGQGTNGAGIDLGEAVWHLLGMRDNTDVMWEFVDFSLRPVTADPIT